MKSLSLVLVFISYLTFAQHRMVGVAGHYGFIFAHSKEVHNTDGSYPRGVEVSFRSQKSDTATWNLCACYPSSGLAISYFDFNNSILGSGLNAMYFIEPSFQLFRSFYTDIKASVGLSYLTNPFHPTDNPTNMSYSLPISAYLGLSGGISYHLSNRTRLQVMANYLHISNGGIKDPNKGINWPTVSVGLSYALHNQAFPSYSKMQRDKRYESKKHLTLYLFASSKIVEVGDKERYGVYGLALETGKAISNLHGLLVSAEFHYDFAMQEKLRREQRQNDESGFAGLSAGHAFLLGKFSFSQQMGVYLYKNNPSFTWLYQRWGLTYQYAKHIQAGINLKAHANRAHFLDARIGYNF